MELVLKRISDTGLETFGVLLLNSHPICLTLELPWHNNERNKSCIPAGTYPVRPEKHAIHGDCWRLENVPDRDGILIHSANKSDQLRGCIAPGSSFEDFYFIGVSNSKDAMARIKRTTQGRAFNLVVVNAL